MKMISLEPKGQFLLRELCNKTMHGIPIIAFMIVTIKLFFSLTYGLFWDDNFVYRFGAHPSPQFRALSVMNFAKANFRLGSLGTTVRFQLYRYGPRGGNYTATEANL
jgi:hypothetical protein